MKKRIFSLLLALTMLCILLPRFTLPARAEDSYSGTCGKKLTWRFDPDSGKLTIEGSGAMNNYTTGTVPWSNYLEAITAVSLPEGLTSISQSAFLSCSSLTSVTIPNSVTSIGKYAFRSCSALTSVTIPNSVTSIGGYAFYECSALTAIQVASKNPSYSSQDGVLFDKAKTELIQYPAGKADVSYAIPNSVTSIGEAAFAVCSSLTSVTIPNSVISIGEAAFGACSALTSVTIPNSVTGIGSFAFSFCSSLTSVTIPNSVTSIRDYAFWGCSSLTSVTIPESVTSIGDYAFLNCSDLTSVTIPASVTSIGKMAFGWDWDLATEVKRVEGFTIYGQNGSAAQSYAEKNEFRFISLDDLCTDGHDYSYSVTKKPTTSTNGTLTCACSKCAYSTAVSLPKLNKTDYSYKAVKAATCTAKGTGRYTWKTTEYGSFSFDVSLKALGHDWKEGELSLKPEAAESEQLYTCARCGETKTEKLSNKPFADVSSSKFYNVPVLWAYYHSPQITSGTSATLFSPNQPCTRGQVVTFLWRANGEQQPKSSKNPFVDAKAGKYYYNAMLWAVENGVTSGVDATHFQPNGDCTRGQVVTFLWRAAGSPEPKSGKNPFVDVKAGKFYYKAVLWAVENGVTAGTDATHFSPNAGCTRGQVVTFLYRQQAQ